MALARTREALHNGWDKNDFKDAQVILHMLRIGATKQDDDPLAQGIFDIQELSKTHEAVSKAKTEILHRILTHYVPLYFPEIERFRHNSRGDWFFAFLDRFPTPASVTAMGQEAFVEAAWTLVGRKVSKARLLADIYRTAQSPIGLPIALDGPPIAMFRMITAEMRSLIRQRDQIETTADHLGLPRFFGHCYDLCSHSLLCLLFRGQISNRGMEAATIVPAFDVLEHIGARLVTGQVVSLFDEFPFQRRIEALHWGVVPAVALAAHRAKHVVLTEPTAIVMSGILHAAIRMMHQPASGPLPCNRHVERSQCQIVAEVLGHRPADHTAREEVEHDAQVEPPLRGPDIGEVRQPDAVGGRGGKVAPEQVRGNREGVPAVGCAPKPPLAPRRQADRPHQSSNALAADTPAMGTQLGMHARAAIAATAGGVGRVDLGGQGPVGGRPVLSGRAAQS